MQNSIAQRSIDGNRQTPRKIQKSLPKAYGKLRACHQSCAFVALIIPHLLFFGSYPYVSFGKKAATARHLRNIVNKCDKPVVVAAP
jgi:hypothetical protein